MTATGMIATTGTATGMTATGTTATPRRPRAVVFAYHNVGVRCLKVLLAGGVDVALVVTHEDAAGENIWFGSVRQTAESHGLPVTVEADPNAPAFRERVAALEPDFIFSFYYRQMLGEALLSLAPRGALNMHGSLLPAYRGRVPINWAVLHGESQTGATLHYMVAKPDAGDIVGQSAVPILPDDTAGEVFDKVLVAAEICLWQALPGLLAGHAPRIVQNLKAGSYFGGRRPDDGRIDWRQCARRIHDLVRAVAPPYPGAWTEQAGHRIEVLESRVVSCAPDPLDATCAAATGRPAAVPTPARLTEDDGRLLVRCTDGSILCLRRLRIDGDAFGPTAPQAAAAAARLGLPIDLA